MKIKIISVLFAFLLIITGVIFASCGSKESVIDAKPKEGALTTKSLDNIYSAEAVSVLGTALENIEINTAYPFSDEKLVIVGYDMKEYNQRYYIADVTFTDVKELNLINSDADSGVDEYINNITADTENGILWCVKDRYYYGEEYEYPIANDDIAVAYSAMKRVAVETLENVVVAEPDFSGAFYTEPKEEKLLVKLDKDGNVLSETDLTDLLLMETEDGMSYSGWINSMFVNNGALVMCIEGNKICVIDGDTAEVEKEFKLDEGVYIDRMFADSHGLLYYTSYGENGMDISLYDTETGKSEKVKFPIEGDMLYNYNILPGAGEYDILLVDDIGVYGYVMGDDKINEICNYANSDLDISYGATPTILDDGRIFISYYDYNESENVCLILTKIPKDKIKEKYIITVAAGSYLDREIKSALIKFNRTSDEYKVVFKDYSQYNNESNEWTGANTKLAEDIINNAPGAADIIVFDSSFDYQSLSSKGALADLNVYMESDDSFTRNDYLNNVFEAFEDGGKLYMVTPCVNFQTMATSKSFAAGKTNWTMKQFLDAHNSLEEGETLIAEVTRNDIGNILLQIAFDELIDKDTGRCNFNSDDFKSLLKYLKDVPADYSAYEELWQDENYWLDYEMAYSKGKTKLYPVYISNFNLVPEIEGRFGEEIVFIGFPTSDKNSSGTLIAPNQLLSINSASKVTSGAWKAIKSLFEDEHQNKFAGEIDENGSANTSYRFPVKTSMVEKKKETDLMPRFWVYEDENGEEVKEYYNNTLWLGDSEIELRNSTEDDANTLYTAVKGAKTAYIRNTALLDIVNQEAQAFYDGKKSVDEVADIINSRIQLYVSERM